jgi:nicotinate-nucleotide--dimethylbenzimidazole phosphoribosyltransferase
VIPILQTFDDIRALARQPREPDETAAAAARAREPRLTKPPGGLGRLESLAEWLAQWQGRHPGRIERPLSLVFAANHGVAQRGVSAYPGEVTRQMLLNFQAGGAAINQLCRAAGIGLEVVDAGVDDPTADFSVQPAMSEAACMAAIRLGAEKIADCDIVCIGEMGIGNTTAAAAICTSVFGGPASGWVGMGTGVAGSALQNKIAIVDQGVTRHRGAMIDGLEILRHVGGKEIAAMAGAILGARQSRVPVILDGYVCGAAACALHALNPRLLDHCVAGHVSAEPGHRRLLERLGLPPLLDLGMRLGEGTGAALALDIVRGAAACHAGMATFDEAGVSNKE